MSLFTEACKEHVRKLHEQCGRHHQEGRGHWQREEAQEHVCAGHGGDLATGAAAAREGRKQQHCGAQRVSQFRKDSAVLQVSAGLARVLQGAVST